ncbi:MAG: dihydrofolate reductase family protein [Ruminococcus sp.]|nr:dihydrofolate reductase family protein [Ruminococcus sp.]
MKNDMPYVTCHMVTSIDGKVTGKFLRSNSGILASEVYYDINRKLKGDAFACGRVTMEESFTGGFKPDLSGFSGADIPHEDFIACNHDYYAVSFDRHGLVGWTEGFIHDEDEGYDNCHIIEVLTEDVPAENLAYYRSIGVSYIFAGRNDTDITAALRKLYSLFGIKRLMLEGGSIINGAFFRADAVDELSLVTAPVIADKDDKPLFSESIFREYAAHYSEMRDNGIMWLRYRDKGE